MASSATILLYGKRGDCHITTVDSQCRWSLCLVYPSRSCSCSRLKRARSLPFSPSLKHSLHITHSLAWL